MDQSVQGPRFNPQHLSTQAVVSHVHLEVACRVGRELCVQRRVLKGWLEFLHLPCTFWKPDATVS